MMTSPGDHSDWLPVDDCDVRVGGPGWAALELSRQEDRRLHIFVERLAVLHHADVADHRYGHAQVSTCKP